MLVLNELLCEMNAHYKEEDDSTFTFSLVYA